ncbi:hypothetical protein GCM10027256_34740 [Novispirillum itersonii subsp. nipponicum]
MAVGKVLFKRVLLKTGGRIHRLTVQRDCKANIPIGQIGPQSGVCVRVMSKRVTVMLTETSDRYDAPARPEIIPGSRLWRPPVIHDVSVEMTRKTSSTMESVPGFVKNGS